MKLIFFLVAFFLVSIRVYFSWAGMDRLKRGESEFDVRSTSDNFNEQLKYSGKFILTDDESGFKSISPGGFLKFVRNNETVKAESNLQGKIEYRLFDGSMNLSPGEEKGKKLIELTVHEMIYWGFDAEHRMERVYKNGGVPALLREVDSMKMDNLKGIYLTRLLSIDSLAPQYMPQITNKIGSLSSDREKSLFLCKISSGQLSNPLISDAYFTVMTGIGSDMDKVNALQHLIDGQHLSDSNTLKLMEVTGTLGSDMDRKNLFYSMIEAGLIDSSRFDNLLNQISKIGSDMDKTTLYNKLIEYPHSESQWISLINKVTELGSEMDIANLLISIAPKIPKTNLLKETYLSAAKIIRIDGDYGRVIRAIQ